MRTLISYVVEIGSIHLHCFIGLQIEARLGQITKHRKSLQLDLFYHIQVSFKYYIFIRNSTMKFQSTALILLLLNASASSFATSSFESKSMKPSSSSVRLPFLHRGGVSSASKLSASVETSAEAAVSDANLDLLSERGRKAVLSLVENDVNGSQSHVYGDWPEVGTQDEDKIRLSEQVSRDWFYASHCGSLVLVDH